MRQRWQFLLLVILLGCTLHAGATGFLRAEGSRIVDADNQPVILRGMGLGGWMLQEGYMLELGNLGPQHKIRAAFSELIGPEKTAEFYQAWLQNFITKADIDAMASWGYNSVRLPLHYNLFTLPVEQEPVPGQHTWLDTGFEMTDQLLQWAKANRIYLILDLHAAPGGQGNDLAISDRDPSQPSLWQSDANRQKTIALWQKLAGRYADEPWIGGYDILNEPNWGFSTADDRHGCQEQQNQPLRQLMVDITRAIRQADKNHIIFLSGNCWGNNYNGIMPPWDDNLVLSFHKYWNENTTESIAGMLTLRDKYQIPLWLGESGENSNQWFSEAIALAESHGIGWAFWPLKKIRLNNPLQIQPNSGYLQLVQYLHGRAEKPGAEQVYQALMTLARHDVRFEQNLQHPDVVDAMLQQPHRNSRQPFKPHHITASGGDIKAVDYDLGGQLRGYYSELAANYSGSPATADNRWNQGMVYRNDGVDISRSTQLDDYYVSRLAAGEWLHYSFSAGQAGNYRISAEVMLTQPGAEVLLTLNQQPLTPAILQATRQSGWQQLVLAEANLQAGNNSLRLQSQGQPLQLYRLIITPLP
ncbi:cellulase family glycosylhydrolase [Chromatiaceae bacterium AAb-1]|nr:cellulase family glycosylhydrolase [Chromatiaceae bacterium AAb-1]